MMFDLGLGFKDWARIAWTFVQGALAWATAAALDWVPGESWNWRTFLLGALAAGWSFVKNLLLADDARIK